MKILHINASMHGGGVEAMICGLANEMAKIHEVTVCSIFECTDSDIYYNRLSDRVKKVSCHKQKKGFSLKEIFSIFKLIATNNFDIVHIHADMYYYMLSILTLWWKTKFVYTVHQVARYENTKWDKRLFFIKRFIFRYKLAHVVTISEASQDTFYTMYHCASALIYNGINEPIFPVSTTSYIKAIKKSEQTKVFLHAGRIDYQKNQVVLCSTFRKLIEDGYDVILIMAGGIHNEEILKNIQPYLGERIRYIGERDDIQLLLKDCDAMCLPSLYEGMPMVIIEAFAVECIPICSPVGGVINMIEDGVNGLLSASASEVDYYNCMKRFLSLDRESIINIKQNSRNSFNKYLISTAVRNYLNFYSSILGKKK